MLRRTNLDESRVALFSDDLAYRYELLVRWDDSLPLVANIGLNPSTADEFKNDPTVARDVRRAAELGFGSLLKLNLFAIRSTDPKGMLGAENPYGEWDYTYHLFESAQENDAAMIIAAWGNNGRHLERADRIREFARMWHIQLHAYEINKSGEPVHPLYKPYSLRPTPYIY